MTAASARHYRNVSKFLGRATTLDYVVEKVVPGQIRDHRHQQDGRQQGHRDGHPAAAGGAEVEYRADMTFKGLAAALSPLLSPFLKKLADDTQAQLLRTLEEKADV